MRQAESVVEMSHPSRLGDLLDAVDLLVIKEFGADVAFGNERKVVLKLLYA